MNLNKSIEEYKTDDLIKMSALIDAGLQKKLIPEDFKSIGILLEIGRELTLRETG